MSRLKPRAKATGRGRARSIAPKQGELLASQLGPDAEHGVRTCDSRSLGQRVKTLREASGVGQVMLARQIGTSQATLCRIENGEVNPSEMRWKTVQAFADRFQVSAEFLMGRDWLAGQSGAIAMGGMERTSKAPSGQWSSEIVRSLLSRVVGESAVVPDDAQLLAVALARIPSEVRDRVIAFMKFEMSRL